MNQQAIDKTVCVFADARSFSNFVNSLRQFTSDKHPYMLLESNSFEIVGYACDGMKLAKQVYQDAANILEPFSLYISPLRVSPTSTDGMVYLLSGEGYAYIKFGDIQLRTTQPANPLDFHKLYDSVQTETVGKVIINRNYLRQMAISLYVPGRPSCDKVTMELQEGPYTPVKFSSGPNERYILPIRASNEEEQKPNISGLKPLRDFIRFLASEHKSAIETGVNSGLWASSVNEENGYIEQLNKALDNLFHS